MLQDKYETKTDSYYGNYRQDILPLVPKHVGKVLEIGCGTGNTLAYLKANGYCDWVCGVELFPNAAREAAPKLDKLYEDNVEEMRLQIEPASIDMILCLDVLEHLVNPQKVVAYLHTLLAPGGVMIASIPNVRHHSVVVPLVLQNSWDYRDSGVLDNTHLRFFVRRSAVELMKSSGLRLEKSIGSNFYSDRWDKVLNTLSLGLLKSFFFKNYLVKVSKAV
jgi:2-polyprenyl-3-methyl-5-hydroxy-6-metoxy-1,4-benzoquinol methylase